MIRVLVEVGNGEARFSVTARAKNIEQAVEIVRSHYPSGEAQVVYPIEPETFFVKDSDAVSGLVELHMREPTAR